MRAVADQKQSAGTTNMAWWQGKEVIREYLKEVNEKETVRFCTSNNTF